MTAEQLEELLGGVTQGEWVTTDLHSDYILQILRRGNGERDIDIGNVADATIIALAPSLARRVIAAEKLVEEVERVSRMISQRWQTTAGDKCFLALDDAATAYREASK